MLNLDFQITATTISTLMTGNSKKASLNKPRIDDMNMLTSVVRNVNFLMQPLLYSKMHDKIYNPINDSYSPPSAGPTRNATPQAFCRVSSTTSPRG